MPTTYQKKIYPSTWKRSYTPPAQYYEMSFDTSSQYITNTITPFDIKENSTAIYQTANSNVVTFTEDLVDVHITMLLADEWTSITWWTANSTPMTAWTSITITEDILFTPTVIHQVIHRDTQWPCSNWFHIGTKDEWQALITALTTLWAYDVNNIKTYLKIPDAYYLARSSGKKETKYWKVRIWTSTMTANNVAWCWWIDENSKIIFQEDKPGNAFSIRPFKDKPVSVSPSDIGVDWTILYIDNWTGWWIFWNSTKWLISLTANWTDWYTISDKNLWATNVWDNWLFYQFWNNTWYTYNASPYVTSKPTLSDNYWPGNYYTGPFVRVSSGNNWFNWACNNIWWWVTDWDRDS